MQTFEAYLNQQNLEALTVSLNAKVRYLTVYNAMKGIPITPEHARQLRQTVLAMSGVPFTGIFALTEPEPLEETPTLFISRIPKHHLM